MEIKLNWEQWKLLKELLRVAEMLETKSPTGSARLDDQNTGIDLHEDITITLPGQLSSATIGGINESQGFTGRD